MGAKRPESLEIYNNLLIEWRFTCLGLTYYKLVKNWCFLLSKIILIFYWEFRRGVFINMICLKLCLFCLFRKEKLSNFVNICLQILKTNVVNRVRWRHVKLDVGALIQVYVTVNMGRLVVLVLWISKSMLDHDILLISFHWIYLNVVRWRDNRNEEIKHLQIKVPTMDISRSSFWIFSILGLGNYTFMTYNRKYFCMYRKESNTKINFEPLTLSWTKFPWC